MYDSDGDANCNVCNYERSLTYIITYHGNGGSGTGSPSEYTNHQQEDSDAKTDMPEGNKPVEDRKQTIPVETGGKTSVITGDKAATGSEPEAESTKTTLSVGEGKVVVTVVCEDENYTVGVTDASAVGNAVLTPEQVEHVNNGETVEIRIDVKDISKQVPGQDKEVIESGMEEYRKEVPGLVLGMYVDISMFIKIGEGDWNAVTEVREPVEIIIEIPEELQKAGRTYYIIRAHEGEYALMKDMDDEPDTITIRTDRFSSYAIAYEEADGAANGNEKCRLCHICPTFLGICCFIWLAVLLVAIAILWIVIQKKHSDKE